MEDLKRWIRLYLPELNDNQLNMLFNKLDEVLKDVIFTQETKEEV
jgi:hypothetical protein